MYAIVNIAGQQYKVEKEQKLYVQRLNDKEGDTVSFDEVLLIDNDKNIVVGEPTIPGAMITGKVLSHPKGDKVRVFKKKKRKGYKVLRGHRQYLTEIQIEEILEKAATRKPVTTAKAEPAKETAGKKPVAKEKKTTAGKKAEPEKKAPATKKAPAAKKAPATKKASAEKKAPSGKTAAPKKETESKGEVKKSGGTASKATAKKPADKKSDKK